MMSRTMLMVTLAVTIATVGTVSSSVKQSYSDVDNICRADEFWRADVGACIPCTMCSPFSVRLVRCKGTYDTICVKNFKFSNMMRDGEGVPVMELSFVPDTTDTVAGTASAPDTESRFFSQADVLIMALFPVLVFIFVLSTAILLYWQRQMEKKRICTYDSLEVHRSRLTDEDCPRYTQDPTSLFTTSRQTLKSPTSRHLGYSSTSGYTNTIHLNPQAATSSSAAGPVLWFPSRDIDMYDSDPDVSGQSSSGSGSGEYVYIRKVPPGAIEEPI